MKTILMVIGGLALTGAVLWVVAQSAFYLAFCGAGSPFC
jgi:hypothetical protein